MKKEKEIWQKNKMNEYANDSSSIWKNVKNWLGWSSGGPPTKLSQNGTFYSKPKDL